MIKGGRSNQDRARALRVRSILSDDLDVSVDMPSVTNQHIMEAIMWPIQSGHLTACSDVNRLALAEPRMRYEERNDGSFVLSSMEELGEYDRSPAD